MPKSKKPKKAYRPKYAPGQLPITIRHSAKADMHLKVVPHDELEKLRNGQANDFTINTLAFRLNWGYVMAGEIFDNPEIREIMVKGLHAVTSIRERESRLGKYGATAEEFYAIGEALGCTDDMQTKATRKEQNEAMEIVCQINELRRKGAL